MRGKITAIRERAKIEELWCLPPETLVFTPQGLKKICDVKVGDLVLGKDGTFTRVKAVLQRPHRGELVELRIGFVRNGLLITPDHYVLVAPDLRTPQRDMWREKLLNGEMTLELEWKKASELDVTDFLVMPAPKAGVPPKQLDLREFSKRKLKIIDDTYAVHKHDHFKREFKYRIDLNNEFYELLGLYLAEGWICEQRRSAGVYFAVGKHETDLAERITKLAGSVFDTEVHWQEHKTCLQLYIGNATIADFFKLFGKRSEEKMVIPELLPFNDPRAVSLVHGFIEGDGHVHEDIPAITLATVSPMLAGQLYLLLLSQGILPSIDIREPRISYSPSFKRFVIGRNKNYFIVISGEYCEKFHFNIRRKSTHKGMRGIVYNGLALIPIYEVSVRDYNGIVYNLTTEDNTYTVLGGVVHNCAIKHMLNAEEHLLETVQKLAREKTECENVGDKEGALEKLGQIAELSEIADTQRWLRQRTVDVIFSFIGESKLRELLLEILEDPARLKSFIGVEKIDEIIKKLSEKLEGELGGKTHAVQEEEKQSSGEEGSGEDPRIEEDLFKEYVPQKV